MSAPDTNIEKQQRRHKGPLIGITAGLILAGGMLFALMLYTSDQGGVPQGAETQIDGRTGAEVAADE